VLRAYPATRRRQGEAHAPLNGEPPFVSEMTQSIGAESASGWRLYAADVPASRPLSDYTPRIIPSYSGAKVPLEDGHILWFR
jgi:starch phosphorylase